MMVGNSIWNVTLFEGKLQQQKRWNLKLEFSSIASFDKSKFAVYRLTCSIPKFSLSSCADDNSLSSVNCLLKRRNCSRVSAGLSVVDDGVELSNFGSSVDALVGAVVVLYSEGIF